MLINSLNKVCAAVLILSLFGCGGGGGGSSGGGGITATSGFNTNEFRANFGLASINALTAYDNLATGSGVIVGVIDTGIDFTHPDLASNISPNSSFVAIVTSSAQDIIGHGTAVAGVIAATRNSVGTHGVAFESTILSVKVSDIEQVLDSAIAPAIDFAVAQGVDVLNLSFGTDRTGRLTTEAQAIALTILQRPAIQRAVDAGVVVVSAAGNIGGAETDLPAALSNCTGGCVDGFDAKGLMIAAGSVGRDNNISSFSNRAGNTASAYMLAPGDDIVTTALGGGTVTVDGTSYSAPHVSGAIALLLQRFPSLTGAQAVSLLLTTATDLGVVGTDTTFGVGLLNLQAAFAAQGLSRIPLTSRVSGISASLNSSQVRLGLSFGSALSEQEFLARAIILDAYDRAYHVDLRDRIVGNTPDLAVAPFFEISQSQLVSLSMPKGYSLSFDIMKNNPTVPGHENSDFTYGSGRKEPSQNDIGTILFSVDLSKTSDINVAHEVSTLSFFSNRVIEESSGDIFFNSSWISSPQLALLGIGDSFKFSHSISDSTTLDIGIHHSGGFSSGVGAGAGNLAQAHLVHKASNGFSYGLTTGYVSEKNSLFSSSSSGAFGSINDNQSLHTSLSASWEINENVNIFATYTDATVEPSFSGGGLLDNWSRIFANSFAVGLTAQSQFLYGDRLGVSLGQPLRVRKSNVDVTLPVSRDLSGNIVQETQRVNLAPTGRQIDMQLAYSLKVGGQSDITSFATLSLQPGHSKFANPESAVGLKWRHEF